MDNSERKFFERLQRQETVAAIRTLSKQVSRYVENTARSQKTLDSSEVQTLRKQKEEALAATSKSLELLRAKLEEVMTPVRAQIYAVERDHAKIIVEFDGKIQDARERAFPKRGQVPQIFEVMERWVNAWLFSRFSKGRRIFDLTADQLAKDFEQAVKDGWTPTL